MGLVPGKHRLSYDVQLCTSEIYQPTLCQLGDVCTLLHHLLLSAQVQHGRSVTTPGQFKDRSDSESPLIYMGVNQADIWLKTCLFTANLKERLGKLRMRRRDSYQTGVLLHASQGASHS